MSKIEGIPDGWELVRIGVAVSGDTVLMHDGMPKTLKDHPSGTVKNWPIIRRIPPPLSIPPKVFADGWIVQACGESLHCKTKPTWNGTRWQFIGSVVPSSVKCAQFRDGVPFRECICRVTWEHGSECEQC